MHSGCVLEIDTYDMEGTEAGLSGGKSCTVPLKTSGDLLASSASQGGGMVFQNHPKFEQWGQIFNQALDVGCLSMELLAFIKAQG